MPVSVNARPHVFIPSTTFRTAHKPETVPFSTQSRLALFVSNAATPLSGNIGFSNLVMSGMSVFTCGLRLQQSD